MGGLARAGAVSACPVSEGIAHVHGGDGDGRRGAGDELAAEGAPADARREEEAAGTAPAAGAAAVGAAGADAAGVAAGVAGVADAAVGGEGLPRQAGDAEDWAAEETRLGRVVYSTMTQQEEP